MFSKNDSGKKRVLGSIAQGAVAAALVASLGPVAGVVAPTLATTAFAEGETQTATATETKTTEEKTEAKTVVAYDAKTNKLGVAKDAKEGETSEFLSNIKTVSVKKNGSDSKAVEYTPDEAKIIDDRSVDIAATTQDDKDVFSGDGTYTLVVTSSKEAYKPLTFEITITNDELSVPVYRLYNPYDFLRLYTTDKSEYDHLTSIGWNGEKVGWQSPTEKDSTPVYRLYNKYNGEHLYTVDKKEYDYLQTLGWSGEDIAFYSTNAEVAKEDAEHYQSVERFYNPYIKGIGSTHHFTLDASEQKTMTSDGWKDEGVAFYAIKSSDTKETDDTKADDTEADEDDKSDDKSGNAEEPEEKESDNADNADAVSTK